MDNIREKLTSEFYTILSSQVVAELRSKLDSEPQLELYTELYTELDSELDLGLCREINSMIDG